MSMVQQSQKHNQIGGHTEKRVLRDNSMSMFRNLYSEFEAADDKKVNKHAVMYPKGGAYYGIQATINVYDLPTVRESQSSSATIWVANSNGDKLNVVHAGWQVDPTKYGDHHTHFFVFWTADGYEKTGCLNLECPGFILDNTTKYVPGYKIQPVSTYKGEQYEITLKIFKSPKTGDWWLYSGRGGVEPVGYWPKHLFTTLADYASNIEIGGGVNYDKGDLSSPPMGNGHLPINSEAAAYIRNIEFLNKDGSSYKKTGQFYFLNDMPGCYLISETDSDDIYFFGGPGGCHD